MTLDDLFRLRQTRRTFLGSTARSIGGMALASLLSPSVLRGAASTQPTHYPGMIHPLHFAPKAKRVIHLYMAGGPSHLETLDYKPTLAKLSGQPMPDSVTKGQPIAQLQGKELRILEPQYEFKKFGKSGQEICS